MSCLNDATVVQNNNMIGIFDGRDTVRNKDCRSILHGFVESTEDSIFGFRIYIGECVVKDKDFRFNNNCACECSPLALPA